MHSDPAIVVARLRSRIAAADAPALPAVVEELADHLEVDRVLAYGVARGADGFALDFLHAAGFREPCRQLAGRVDRALRRATGAWAAFDPLAPEPAQRNQVVALPPFSELDSPRGRRRLRTLGVRPDQLARTARRLVRLDRGVLGRIELGGLHVCRTLVCDGSRLLAFLGLFRDRPFTPTERRMLAALVPPLRARLIEERLRGWLTGAGGSFAALVEAFPAAAFVVRGDGRIEHANAAARARLGADAALPQALAAAVAGRPAPEVRVYPLSPGGAALVVLASDSPGRVEARVRDLAPAWSLTQRQQQVAMLIARGRTNKDIAVALGCTERGIEYHVTNLLDRTGCRSRSELIARLWSAGALASL